MYKQKTIHNLTFTTFRNPSLPDVVKDIVEVRGHDVVTTKRLYPRNTPEILINLADPIRGEVGSKTAVIEHCAIQGSKTAYVNAWHPRNCDFISIRFTSNGYYKFLGIPQKSLTDRVIRMEDVIDSKLDALIPILQNAPSPMKRFQILIRWLNKAGCQTGKDSPLVSDVIINHLGRNAGLSVNQLTAKTGFTRKHLVQRFKEETGLTIKQYQKINRMYRVLKEIETTDRISWARLACQFGFYDQSHLIKDFKQYTRCTPTDYLEQHHSPKNLVS